MSRIPRFQEHLKTGFTAEAVSAARYRAFAERAEQDGMPQLAARWRRLATAKDRLAIRLLVAAEQVRGLDSDLGAAIAEERYENDVLYPKILRDLGDAGGTGGAGDSGAGTAQAAPPSSAVGTASTADRRAAEVFRQLLTAQQDHLRQLEALRRELTAAQADVQLPPEVDAGTPGPPRTVASV